MMTPKIYRHVNRYVERVTMLPEPSRSGAEIVLRQENEPVLGASAWNVTLPWLAAFTRLYQLLGHTNRALEGVHRWNMIRRAEAALIEGGRSDALDEAFYDALCYRRVDELEAEPLLRCVTPLALRLDLVQPHTHTAFPVAA